MRTKIELLACAVVAQLVLGGCSKKDGSDTAAAEDPGTVVSGASGPWRTTTPPDTTPPVANSSFWGKAGTRLGTVTLSLRYPDDVADYASIVIRRARGKTPPADCASGDVVQTITDFSTVSWEDEGLYPGGDYSYIACLADAAGNSEAAYGNATVKASTVHRMFATSETFDGNLQATYQGKTFSTGLEGADDRCAHLAGQASLEGTWKALVSGGTSNVAYDRVPIYGQVFNLAATPELLAESKDEFWSGRLQHAVGYDETGLAVAAASKFVWSGSYASGSSSDGYTCGAFTSNSSGDYALEGDATDVTDKDAWVVRYIDNCATKRRLYCVESYEGTVAAPTLAATAGTGTAAALAVTFPDDVSAYGSVRLFRQPGKALDNPRCEETYPSTELVKIYSASDATAFTSESLGDETGAEGHYNYLACVFDTSGNLMATSSSSFVTIGTDYKLAFVTAATFDGNLGGVSGANTKCDTAATNASLSGTWKAILADDSNDIFNNIGSSAVQIYDLSGNFLAASFADLASYTTVGTNAVAVDETGTAVASGAKVWTGATGSGAASGSACSNWSSANGAVYGIYGETRTDYGEWLNYSSNACSSTNHLYCVQN
jgi:hypothetical protein